MSLPARLPYAFGLIEEPPVVVPPLVHLSVSLYRVVVADMDGVELEELPAKNLQLSEILNEPGAISFTVPLRHPKTVYDILTPGQRELRVYRAGIRVWGGYLWTVGASSGDAEMRVGGEGYMGRLHRRHVDQEDPALAFEDEDQIDIAWSLIEFTQSKTDGDLGFDRHPDTLACGITRTRKYQPWERVNIGDEIQSMAETRNGFDYEITPYKSFKTYFPERGEDNDIIFELGKNISNISWDEDATEVVTELTGLGAGSDRNQCLAVVTDIGRRGEYGLLQGTEDFNYLRHYDDLVDKTSDALKLRKRPRKQPQLGIYTDDPGFYEYGLGDTIELRAKKGWIDISSDFRLVTKVIQVSNEGREAIQLFFDRLLT